MMGFEIESYDFLNRDFSDNVRFPSGWGTDGDNLEFRSNPVSNRKNLLKEIIRCYTPKFFALSNYGSYAGWHVHFTGIRGRTPTYAEYLKLGNIILSMQGLFFNSPDEVSCSERILSEEYTALKWADRDFYRKYEKEWYFLTPNRVTSTTTTNEIRLFDLPLHIDQFFLLFQLHERLFREKAFKDFKHGDFMAFHHDFYPTPLQKLFVLPSLATPSLFNLAKREPMVDIMRAFCSDIIGPRFQTVRKGEFVEVPTEDAVKEIVKIILKSKEFYDNAVFTTEKKDVLARQHYERVKAELTRD